MDKIDNKAISSEAGRVALIFGLISGGYVLIDPLLNRIGVPVIANGLSIVLWAAKFFGCIYLMRFFMRKLSLLYGGVGRRELLRFGTLVALFSAIITAVCCYVSIGYLFTDQYTAAFDMLWQQMGSALDSNTRGSLQNMESNLAQISTVSNFLWCFIYGWVLSVILSGSVSSSSEALFSDKDDDDDYI